MRWVLVLLSAAIFCLAGCNRQKAPQSAGPQTSVDPGVRLEALTAEQQRSLAEVDPQAERTPGPVIAAVPAPAPETPSAGYKDYTVRPGDMGFYAIARRLYNDPSRWREIEALNPGLDTRGLRIGQTIKVPVR